MGTFLSILFQHSRFGVLYLLNSKITPFTQNSANCRNHFLLCVMGSACSKGSYENLAKKGSKKRGSEKPADLDATMRDGMRI